MICHRDVADSIVRKICDRNTRGIRSGRSGQRRAGSNRKRSIAVVQKHTDRAVGRIHDSKVRHAVGIQIAGRNCDRALACREWRPRRDGECAIESLSRRLKDRDIICELSHDGEVRAGGAQVLKIPADHRDGRLHRRRQRERRFRKGNERAVAVSLECRNCIVAAVGHSEIETPVIVKVGDHDRSRLQPDSKGRSRRFCEGTVAVAEQYRHRVRSRIRNDQIDGLRRRSETRLAKHAGSNCRGPGFVGAEFDRGIRLREISAALVQ